MAGAYGIHRFGASGQWMCSIDFAIRCLPVCDSNLAAVVGPVQQRLTLAAAAGEIAGLAVRPDLADVAAERLPAFDLPRIVVMAAARVIAAVPLKPAARIVG